MMKKCDLEKAVQNIKVRSAWDKGVKAYALDLLENIYDENVKKEKLEDTLLSGACDWYNYSLSGCAFCYDDEIIDRLCTPSEKKRYARRRSCMANPRETFLEVQARALYQAYIMIKDVCR